MSKKAYVNDTVALTALLNEVEGRATTRTVSATEVQALVKQAEKRLTELGVTVAQQRVDVQVIINPMGNRQPTVNAYKYRASATEVVVERNSVGWYVSRVYRSGARFDSVANRQDFFLVLPIEVQQQVTSNALCAFGVSFA